ncbi:MAG: DnaJ domain-containing protein [Dehalococcoidales bacterium]|nr:DnaJ domain-containing protein [Dehalococcoidales bacterium]
MAGKDYYIILGVGRGATATEIKQAYRKLARQHHPDVNPGDKTAEAKFKEINEAYEVLSDTEKRKKYDQFGDQWQYAEQFVKARARQSPEWESGQGDTSFNFEGSGDIFEEILRDFGRGTRGRTAQPRTGRDIEYPVQVTLEEAYHGISRLLNIQGEDVCNGCGGTGRIQNLPCSVCRGSGKVIRDKRIEVKIPSGVDNGSRVRFARQGEPGYRGGPNGDLYLIVSILPHSTFERQGDNLLTTVDLPLTTAMLGGEIQVPTLKGKLMLKIPPETQNGRIFNLNGKGMPHLGGSSYGNLLAKVNVVLPGKLTKEEKALFEKLKEMRDS